MRKIFLVVMVLLLNTTYSQEYSIISLNYNYIDAIISVDRTANEIYISDWIEYQIGKYEFSSNSIVSTDITGLPKFMNNSHKAIYREITDSSNIYYLYDFVTENREVLFEYLFSSPLLKTEYFYKPFFSISPNDKYLFVGSLFVISDSIWLNMNEEMDMYGYRNPYSWSGDSTIVYLSQTNAIAEYNIYTQTIDTLVTRNSRDEIFNLRYNIKEDLLAYSIENMFYVYDKRARESICNFEGESWGRVEIREMQWNENEENIVFLGYDFTNPITYIYVYSVDSNKVFEVPNSDYGLKSSLDWLNNDTIVYVKHENDLYGCDITGAITNVEGSNVSLTENYTLFQNYPNPFNPSTKIEYRLKNRDFVSLKVYDVLGREVAILVNREQSAGSYEVEFSAVGGASGLSSGVYFYRITAGSFMKTMKMIVLK